MLNILFNVFIFPGFLFSCCVGFFISWLDRKITARLQYRVGPPLLQPYYDIRKLFAKEIIIPENASVLLFLLGPVVTLSACIVVAVYIGRVILGWEGFSGDIILLIYILMIPPIMTVLGALSSGNPLSVLGASREIKLLLSYEVIFILSILVPIFKSQSVTLTEIINYQMAHGAVIFSLSGFLAFLLAVVVVGAKLGVVPFDVAEAETEIASGIYMEYSGPLLAFYKLSKTILLVALPSLVIALYFPSRSLIFIIKYFIIVVILTLIRNTNPRLRIDQILKFLWTWGLATGLTALAFALVGL